MRRSTGERHGAGTVAGDRDAAARTDVQSTIADRQRRRQRSAIDVGDGHACDTQCAIFRNRPKARRYGIDRRIVDRIDGQRNGRDLAVAVDVRIAVRERIRAVVVRVGRIDKRAGRRVEGCQNSVGGTSDDRQRRRAWTVADVGVIRQHVGGNSGVFIARERVVRRVGRTVDCNRRYSGVRIGVAVVDDRIDDACGRCRRIGRVLELDQLHRGSVLRFCRRSGKCHHGIGARPRDRADRAGRGSRTIDEQPVAGLLVGQRDARRFKIGIIDVGHDSVGVGDRNSRAILSERRREPRASRAAVQINDGCGIRHGASEGSGRFAAVGISDRVRERWASDIVRGRRKDEIAADQGHRTAGHSDTGAACRYRRAIDLGDGQRVAARIGIVGADVDCRRRIVLRRERVIDRRRWRVDRERDFEGIASTCVRRHA